MLRLRFDLAPNLTLLKYVKTNVTKQPFQRAKCAQQRPMKSYRADSATGKHTNILQSLYLKVNIKSD